MNCFYMIHNKGSIRMYICFDDCCPNDGYICSISKGDCVSFRPDICSGFCDNDNDCSTEYNKRCARH